MAAPAPEQAVGVRLIVYYKLCKGAVEALLAIVLLGLLAAGQADRLHSLVVILREHLVHAWSIELANLLLRGVTRHGLGLTSLALVLDALLSGVEGWLLHRRYRWARWLVVCASSVLLPFEVAQLAAHPSVGHLGLLLVNGVIVAYLVGHAIGEKRRH